MDREAILALIRAGKYVTYCSPHTYLIFVARSHSGRSVISSFYDDDNSSWIDTDYPTWDEFLKAVEEIAALDRWEEQD